MTPTPGVVDIIRHDARHLPIGSGSVRAVITSPPYWAQREYQDGGESYSGQIGMEPNPDLFVDNLLAVTAECARVLTDDGNMFVNLGDKYAGSGGHNNAGITKPRTGAFGERKREKAKLSRRQAPDRYLQTTNAPRKSRLGIPWRYANRVVDELGLVLRAHIVWDKPNGIPDTAVDRVRYNYEDWFHFSKSPKHFGANCGWGSVWRIPTEPLEVPEELEVEHTAAFPTEFPRRFIIGWTSPDDYVLDPFGGTGTTAMVARMLGRHAIHNDMSDDYNRLAEWRVFHDPARHRAVVRSGREDQTSLFD